MSFKSANKEGFGVGTSNIKGYYCILCVTVLSVGIVRENSNNSNQAFLDTHITKEQAIELRDRLNFLLSEKE